MYRLALYVVWCWRVGRRLAKGRSFVMRDAPDWFVQKMAGSDIPVLEAAAREELGTRIASLIRLIDGASR